MNTCPWRLCHHRLSSWCVSSHGQCMQSNDQAGSNKILFRPMDCGQQFVLNQSIEWWSEQLWYCSHQHTHIHTASFLVMSWPPPQHVGSWWNCQSRWPVQLRPSSGPMTQAEVFYLRTLLIQDKLARGDRSASLVMQPTCSSYSNPLSVVPSPIQTLELGFFPPFYKQPDSFLVNHLSC